ncbi:MAG TPA: sigma-70 family RNA polymerase sigma factor, partial [Longimicrobiales bacterium]
MALETYTGTTTGTMRAGDAAARLLAPRTLAPLAPEIATESTEGAARRLAKASFEEEAMPCLDAVYHFALRLTRGDPDEAADLAQETFLRAYRGWKTYQPGTRVLSWLFTICRNAAIRSSQTRGRQSERTLSELGIEGSEALGGLVHAAGLDLGDSEGKFFDSFIDEDVLQAIDELPDEFRDAVVLSDLHELSYAEIANVLRVPCGTVKSRIHR